MKTTTRTVLIILIGCALIINSGCAAQQKKMAKSDFLKDYSILTQDDPLKKADWVYVNPKADFGAYDKILLDHVVFYLQKGSEDNGFEAAEMKELADAFHAALATALSESYEFTEKPGPGVIRLRTAITDLVPTKTGRSTITTIVPVGIVLSNVKKGATSSHIGMGEASIEGEMVDSQTDEVLSAIVDRKTGKKYRIDKSVSKWAHVKDAFRRWSETLADRLDKLSNRK